MKRLSFILPIAIIAVTFLFSCKNASEKAAEEAIEGAYSSEGKDVDVDIDQQGQKVTIETEEGKMVFDQEGTTWPKDIPSEIPQLKGMKISGVTTGDVNGKKSWTVIYEGDATAQMESFSTSLKSAGYKTTKMTINEGGAVTGEKDNWVVSSMFSKENTVLSIGQQ
jgi:hypothetical protein